MAGTGLGTLVAVGGGEDKRDDMNVLRRALEHAPAPTGRVVVIPTASRDPMGTAQPYLGAFRRLGATQVDVLDIRQRDQAAAPDAVERVRLADVVYMTGGDQARLSEILAGTPVLAAMAERLRAGAVVGGTSAGAAALSATMIAWGEARLRKGDVQLAPGLGLLGHAIVDTHFAERGRFGRLVEAVATHPRLLGIGLSEDTGIIVRGDDVEVVGAGSVVVVDGREMRHSNVAEADHAHPLSVERLIVHTYSNGRGFRLEAPPAPLSAPAARRKARA